MKKHWKLIVIIIIAAIAVGAIGYQKLKEKESKKGATITVTVEDKLTNTQYLDSFSFGAKADNLAGFLVNNSQIFNPEFNRGNNEDLLTGLFAINNTNDASWHYEVTNKGNTVVPLTDDAPLNNIQLKTGDKVTFIYED